jgi:hypothetical protein
MGCWIGFRNGAEWVWPKIDADMTVVMYISAVWDGLPHDVVRLLPYACGAGMIFGLGMAIIWPRFALHLGWSLGGASLLTGMGVAALDFGQPQWLTKIPNENWAQASIFGSLVILGTLVQWKLGPKAAMKSAKKKPKEDGGD